jgi:hypothetical protein
MHHMGRDEWMIMVLVVIANHQQLYQSHRSRHITIVIIGCVIHRDSIIYTSSNKSIYYPRAFIPPHDPKEWRLRLRQGRSRSLMESLTSLVYVPPNNITGAHIVVHLQ